MTMADQQWWYCLKHHTVEAEDSSCKAADRLGPYASRDQAEHALERVAQRNDAYDSDPKWGDD
jgi:hypothetical protein